MAAFEEDLFKDKMKELEMVDSSVTSIDFNGLGLGDAEFIQIISVLKTKPHISRLNCPNNDIGDVGIKALTEASLTLKELDLFDNVITSEGAQLLAKMTNRAESRLHTLNLGANLLDDRGANFFKKTGSLSVLHLSCCNITAKGTAEIFANQTLRNLTLSNNDIGDEGLMHLKDSRLEQLEMNDCGLTYLGMPHIVASRTLRMLRVSSNSIGDAGVEILASHPTLQEIDLSSNCIRSIAPFGASTVVKALIVNNNAITATGVKGISENNTIRSLNVGFNLLNDESITEEILNIKSLQELKAEYNNLTLESLPVFVEKMQALPSISADFTNDAINRGLFMSFDKAKKNHPRDESTSEELKSSLDVPSNSNISAASLNSSPSSHKRSRLGEKSE
jgi:Ran GTPase-activating protein (RanGAP) involved in mRNA processing and transport